MSVSKDWKRWYATLRNADEDLYRQAIQAAEGCCLNHGITGTAAAAIEVSHVALACAALGLRPSPLTEDKK